MALRLLCAAAAAWLFLSASAETGAAVRRQSSAALPLQDLVRDWYRREFAVAVPRPAIFNDPRAVDCRGDGHLTTTAYLRTDARTADLLVLYLTRDGLNLIRKSRRTVLLPVGRFRVLSIIVQHPQTTGSDPLSMWRAAQDEVNRQHVEYARGHGYTAPLVAFMNTDVLIEPNQLDALANPEAMAGMLRTQGVTPSVYDIVLTINIDPMRSEGGRTAFGDQRSIYVGNYSQWTAELGAKDWSAIARTAYQQLMAYFWGWQTDWTPTCGGTRLGHEPFITSPRLLGWEDIDGDGVPEVLDDTPYGRRP